MDNINDINKFLKDLKTFYQELGEKTGRVQVLEGLYLTQLTKEYIESQQSKIKTLTDKLIKSNKDYCPERIGYEVGYKYIHEHCNGLDCEKCTRDQIEKGLVNE